jgi:hypothetical protein
MKEYSDFITNLKKSRSTLWDVAEWLTGLGYVVRIIPATTTPNEIDRFQHVDCGDIEIIKRVEVKQWLDIDFNSIDSIKYDNIIVDEAYKVDKFHPKSLAFYLTLNASKTGCIIITSDTRNTWFKEERHDRKEDGKRLFYFCPKDKVRYSKFGANLKSEE